MYAQASDCENSTIYRRVLSSAQNKLSAAINQIRGSIPHSGEIGTLIERQFRSRLEEIMPEKIGVSHGFVVDSSNAVSRQMDIILYDRHCTPRIFTSDGAQMFPVEATYACGEIKTNLDTSKLEDSFQKCWSYKTLCRKAYVEQPAHITKTYSLFGDAHNHWQSIFFCIAVESISASVLIDRYNEIVNREKLPIQHRIDTIVALQPNSGGNVLLNISGEVKSGVPPENSINLLPQQDSKLYSYQANEAWALFSMLLLSYMTQVPTEPINVLRYAGDRPY